MIHRVKEKKLGRDASHRKALIKNLSTSLVVNKKVETTLAKAKYVRPYVERLITRAKKGNDFNTVKFIKGKLTTNDAVKILLGEVAPLFEKRQGGYTRIVQLPERKGDNAKMARLELVIEKPKKTKKEEETEAKTKKSTAKKTVKKEIEAAQTAEETIETEEIKEDVIEEEKAE